MPHEGRGTEHGLGSTPGAGLLRVPGNCCWIARARRFSVLMDAASCFDAFRRAAERAERSILVLAWDFDSRTPLSGDGTHATLRLGDFLNSLARRRRGLQVRVLDWDYPLLYGLDRERSWCSTIAWRSSGASTASRRWDTSAHEPRDPRRLWRGEPYPPFHDVMAMLDGDAARELADIAAARGGPPRPPPRALPPRARARRGASRGRRAGPAHRQHPGRDRGAPVGEADAPGAGGGAGPAG